MRQVTVLGGCGAYPEPGRACSGFLVEWDGFRLVLDLGYATLPRLLMLTRFWPGNDREAAAAAARSAFGGEVFIADEDHVVSLDRRSSQTRTS